MKLHRFIREQFNLDQDELVIQDRRLIHQINNVLRMGEDDKLILCDGSLNEAEVEIKNIDKKQIEVGVLEKYKNENEVNKNVTLYCSILKNKNFDTVVQKCTEVGITEIVPVISERTVKTGLKRKRLKKIIREAAEQSGRGVVPELKEKMKLEKAIEEVGKGVAFDESGEKVSKMNFEGDDISIFIGPEGGWSREERQFFKENDFKMAKLSGLTFRAETAAIVGSYEVLK